MKVDIEYGEWDVFESLFTEQSLTHIKQLGLEIHTHELLPLQTSSIDDFVKYYHVLQTMDRLGFKQWYHHANSQGQYYSMRSKQYQTCCYELVFINTRFIDR